MRRDPRADFRDEATLTRADNMWLVPLRVAEIEELVSVEQEIEDPSDIGSLAVVGELVGDSVA